MAFDEQQDGAYRWQTVPGEKIAGDPLPPEFFSVRDVNADGRPEIALTLRSAGAGSYAEALYLLQWSGKGKLTLLSRILLPNAPNGLWLTDELSHQYPGLQILTVGRCLDPAHSSPYWPTRFTFTYYGWDGSGYSCYRTNTTARRYTDALHALAAENWRDQAP